MIKQEEINKLANIIAPFFKDPIDIPCPYCQAAEAVFKAGKKEGIREVVEWINQNLYDATGEHSICGIFAIPDYKLKAKLKEWGING